jgi:hypothetical protein
MKSKSVPAINIQWPISTLILSGQKSIETRTYPLPEKYVGQELALIETPGKDGKFKARITALIRFGKPFQYRSEKDFYRDYNKHRVDKESKWRWKSESPKWGWPVEVIEIVDPPMALSCRTGIVFTKKVSISNL